MYHLRPLSMEPLYGCYSERRSYHTRMRQLSHRCKGVSPSPANLHRVKRSYVAVTPFYRDDRRRCIEGVSEIRRSFTIRWRTSEHRRKCKIPTFYNVTIQLMGNRFRNYRYHFLYFTAIFWHTIFPHEFET